MCLARVISVSAKLGKSSHMCTLQVVLPVLWTSAHQMHTRYEFHDSIDNQNINFSFTRQFHVLLWPLTSICVLQTVTGRQAVSNRLTIYLGYFTILTECEHFDWVDMKLLTDHNLQ